MKSIEEMKGAHYAWIYCEFYDVYLWLLIYWPVIAFIKKKSQILRKLTHDIWAGFMSESRGLSWDRKSRYGKK